MQRKKNTFCLNNSKASANAVKAEEKRGKAEEKREKQTIRQA